MEVHPFFHFHDSTRPALFLFEGAVIDGFQKSRKKKPQFPFVYKGAKFSLLNWSILKYQLSLLHFVPSTVGEVQNWGETEGIVQDMSVPKDAKLSGLQSEVCLSTPNGKTTFCGFTSRKLTWQ